MTYFRRGDVSIYHYEVGDGEPVLFLHGFPDTSEVWSHQARVFTDAGYRVIAPDLRGFGKSSKDASSYEIREAVIDVLKLLEHLKVERFYLVGHDWGAALSWVLATAVQDRVKAFAALSTGHAEAFFPAGGMEQREKSWYCLFNLHPEAGPMLRADDWALWRAMMVSEPREIVEQQIRNMSQEGALESGLGWYRANITCQRFGKMKSADEVPLLRMPVLGLWSDRDRFLTEAQMQGSARFVEDGKFEYKRVEGAGHWMQLEAAEEVSKTLLTYFESVAGRSAL